MTHDSTTEPTPIEAARKVAATLSLDGDYPYTVADRDVIHTLLQYDIPSKYIDDPFYWAWYNARRDISNTVWDSFIAAVYASHPRALSTELAKTGLSKRGMDTFTREILAGEYQAIPIVPFNGDDFIPGYFFDPNMTQAIGHDRDLANEFRIPSEKLLGILSGFVKASQSELETILGHPFRITTARLFSLKPGLTEFGADHWHLDGWPVGMKKLQIYLDETSAAEHGSTQFRLKDGTEAVLEGPPGMWAVFENSAVYHRAVPPLQRARPTIELSIAPAITTDTTCVNAGLNAGYPWFPPEFEIEDPTSTPYTQGLAVKSYIRALHWAVNVPEQLRGTMPEHFSPRAGQYAPPPQPQGPPPKPPLWKLPIRLVRYASRRIKQLGAD